MQLKVIDFGLSRGVVDERDLKFMTRAGTGSFLPPSASNFCLLLRNNLWLCLKFLTLHLDNV